MAEREDSFEQTCEHQTCGGNEQTFPSIQDLARHISGTHVFDIICGRGDCVCGAPDITDRDMESHILQHIYTTTIFESLDSWCEALPSGYLDEHSTDLRLCPPALRGDLNLLLLDSSFTIKKMYIIFDHMIPFPFTTEEFKRILRKGGEFHLKAATRKIGIQELSYRFQGDGPVCRSAGTLWPTISCRGHVRTCQEYPEKNHRPAVSTWQLPHLGFEPASKRGRACGNMSGHLNHSATAALRA
ncbi:uncharacterized protein [Argopecten irradians]|uniref:uncharacterized protein n=1 Tax=Argopecten irradians TaxID=31199 RepID=UPI003714624D